ncbi:MAG: MFS transporter, partial [Alphaproteobacteria bacterium]
MASDKTLAGAEWKMGWPLVLACSFGFSMSTVMSHSLGLFMQPLQTDMGWSRSQIAIGFTISSISSIFLSPIAGAMIDRWGSRWLAIPGVALTALGLAAFGLVESFLMWLALWGYYAFVSMGVKLTVWTTATSKAFTASRGLAVACVIAGTAFTGVLAPPVTNWLIDSFGWRHAFMMLGLGWG